MKKTQKIISMVLAVMLLFSCAQALPVSAAENGAEEAGALPPPHFLFTDSLNWGNVCAYAWNDSGDIGSAWPGDPLSFYEINEYGQVVYEVYVPYGATGVVINGGNNEQTDNIIDFNPGGGGYYLDPDKTTVNEFGATVYIPIPNDFAELTYTIGDADANETININDVTAIQKFLAKAPLPNTFKEETADADQNETVNINDATLIQYYLAGIENNNSCCGETFDYTLPEYTLYFNDVLNWGNVSLIARDNSGNILRTFKPRNGFPESVYYCKVPYNTAFLVVVSEDGTKQTELSDFYRKNYESCYVAWNRSNGKYFLKYKSKDKSNSTFDFVNTLGWENICVTSWDKYGNVVDEFVLESESSAKYTIELSLNATKAVLSNGAGEETNYIYDFYDLYGNKHLYYLDETKTTVNNSGKTVYRPIRYSGINYPNPPEFILVNALNWTNLHVYAWNEDGDSVTAEWPGDKLTDFEINDFGQEIYTVTVPMDAAGVIINGDEGQTDIICDFNPRGGGYYLSEYMTTTNGNGETVYIPQTWYEAPSI